MDSMLCTQTQAVWWQLMAPQLCTAGQPHLSTHISSVRIAAHLKHAQCCCLQKNDDPDTTSRTPGTPSVPFLYQWERGARRQSRRAQELCSTQGQQHTQGRHRATQKSYVHCAGMVQASSLLSFFVPSHESQQVTSLPRQAQAGPVRPPQQDPGPSCCQHACRGAAPQTSVDNVSTLKR